MKRSPYSHSPRAVSITYKDFYEPTRSVWILCAILMAHFPHQIGAFPESERDTYTHEGSWQAIQISTGRHFTVSALVKFSLTRTYNYQLGKIPGLRQFHSYLSVIQSGLRKKINQTRAIRRQSAERAVVLSPFGVRVWCPHLMRVWWGHIMRRIRAVIIVVISVELFGVGHFCQVAKDRRINFRADRSE